MGHDDLRHDTECLNCGHTVEQKYCPNCGQKNTETRQPFAHLVGHFAEDLTHYDSAFWKTMKYLLFRPGFLTTQYLIGKRQLYVPPVKLYIFLSFVAFLIPALIPANDKEEDSAERHTYVKSEESENTDLTMSMDMPGMIFLPSIQSTDKAKKILSPVPYTSVKQMDSIESLKPDSLRLNALEYRFATKMIKLYQHNTEEQVYDKFMKAAPQNVPKTLFIYMPLFAFWIWVFHGKKKWYFFDHSIFTLHYFSFLLLTNSILISIFKLLALFKNDALEAPAVIILFGILVWQIYYFYRSHRKMYYEKWFMNFIKCTALFVINMLLIIFLLACLLIYTYYNLH